MSTASQVADPFNLGPNARIVGEADRAEAGPRFESHVHVHLDDELSAIDAGSVALESALPIAATLAGQLLDQKLLVLGGDYDDKPTVARQVARMAAETAGAGGARPILQWRRGSDLHGLRRGLQQQARPAVVLLIGVAPHEVGRSLSAVYLKALERNHLVVATTDQTRASWRLSTAEEGFWRTLDPAALFDESTLAGLLGGGLAGIALPAGAFVEGRLFSDSTLAGISLGEIARLVRTPAKVAVFLQQVGAAAAQGELTEPAVRAMASAATSEEGHLARWFHGLSSHAQLLSVGLTLFDGLAEDQCFAALERWVGALRNDRNPAVRAFDYADLDELEDFFAFEPAAEGARKLAGRRPNQRKNLIRVAWGTHRRHLLGALPLLTELATRTEEGNQTDWELFRSDERRRQVRRAIVQTLTDLGTLSRDGVEHALLLLAGDEDPEVQAVAADAMAGWRGDGGEAQLFELLARWQQDARVLGKMEARRKLLGDKDEEGGYAYVRTTVAMAVGFAAEYDAPNQLTPELVALVEQLAADDNKLVRARFKRYTLMPVVAQHLGQLRSALRGMMGDRDLLWAIGAALAHAYGTVPKEVVSTVEAWHAEGEASRPATFHPGRITERDALVMTLAYTYGEMSYEDGGPIDAELGFRRLQEILTRESHPAIRAAVATAITRQAEKRFTAAEPLLQRLMSDLKAAEREKLVGILTDVYRDQRAALQGGTGRLKIGRRTYPVWLDSGRPLTPVEGAMVRWARNPAYPAAQAVAVRASVRFVRAVDEAEAKHIESVRRRRSEQASLDAAAHVSTAPMQPGVSSPGWYTGTLVPWLATRGAPEYAPIIRGLLPEALAQNATSPVSVQFVLDRWRRLIGDAAPRTIAERLRSAMTWHGVAWVGPISAALILLFLLSRLTR
jgi:hypothetical protein